MMKNSLYIRRFVFKILTVINGSEGSMIVIRGSENGSEMVASGSEVGY